MFKLRLVLAMCMAFTIVGCSPKAEEPSNAAGSNSVVQPVVTDLLDDASFVPVPKKNQEDYKARHKFTATCNGLNYGVSSYKQMAYGFELTLLSGQILRVSHDCIVRTANTNSSLYLYDKVL